MNFLFFNLRFYALCTNFDRLFRQGERERKTAFDKKRQNLPFDKPMGEIYPLCVFFETISFPCAPFRPADPTGSFETAGYADA